MDETHNPESNVPVFFAEPSAFNHYSVATLIETCYQVQVILLTRPLPIWPLHVSASRWLPVDNNTKGGLCSMSKYILKRYTPLDEEES